MLLETLRSFGHLETGLNLAVSNATVGIQDVITEANHVRAKQRNVARSGLTTYQSAVSGHTSGLSIQSQDRTAAHVRTLEAPRQGEPVHAIYFIIQEIHKFIS